MKKVKLFLTAASVFAIVGSAFAFKAAHKSDPNLFICSNNVCAFDPDNAYSTTPNGSPVTNPPTTYTGTAGATCGTSNCQQNTLTVYIND